jgi:type II secretory pathway pseudopilin PulG
MASSTQFARSTHTALGQHSSDFRILLSDAAGVTLIESTIALGLIAVLVVTMAGLIAVARDVTVLTRRESIALALAQARLEELQGLTFSTYGLASGGTVEMTDFVTDLSTEMPSIGGRGLATGPADALVEPRRGYVDYLDAEGRWLGADAGAVPRASFTRRWTVRRMGAGLAEIVAFDVMVAPAAVAASASGPNVLSQPGVVRLAGMRARRAR